MNDVQDWGNLLACCLAVGLDIQSLPVRGLPQSLLRQHGQRFHDLCGNLRQEWQNILVNRPMSALETHLAQIIDPQLKAELDDALWQHAQDVALSDLPRADRRKAKRQHAKQHKPNKSHKTNKIAAEPWLYNILLLFYATPPLSNWLFSAAVSDPDQGDKGKAQHQLLLPHRIILQCLNIAEDAPSSQHLSVEDGFLALQWLSEHTNLCCHEAFQTQITRLALDWPYAVVAYQRVIEALRRWESVDDKDALLLVLWALQVLTLWSFALDDAAHMAHFLALCGVPENASLLEAWCSSSKSLPHVNTPDAWRICPPEISEAQTQGLQIDPHLVTLPWEVLARFFLSARGHLQASFAQSEQPPCAIADYFRVHPAHACLNMPTWEMSPNLALDVMMARFLQQCVLHLQRQMQDFAQHFFLRSVKSHWQSQLQSLQTLTQESNKQADLREILTYLNRATCLHFADQDWADWQSLDGEWIKALQQCQQLLDQERQQAQAAAQQQHLDELVQQLTNLAKQALDALFDDEKQAALRADVLALLVTALNLPAGALNALQTWQENLPNVLSLSDFETMLRSLKQAQQALDAPPQDAELWQAQMANLRAVIDLATELAAAPTSDVLPETLPDVVADVSPEAPAKTPAPAAPDLSAENQRLRNKIKELDNKNHALATQKFSDLYQSEEGKWQQWADDVLRLLDKQGTRPEQILSAAAACFVNELEMLPSALETAAQYRRAEYSAKELLLTIYKLCRVYLPLYLQGGDNLARSTFGQNYSAKESDSVLNNERMRKQREFVYRGQKTLFIQHLRINAYLRLYFKVDQNKIIIAYVGEHLDCGQTN